MRICICLLTAIFRSQQLVILLVRTPYDGPILFDTRQNGRARVTLCFNILNSGNERMLFSSGLAISGRSGQKRTLTT